MGISPSHSQSNHLEQVSEGPLGQLGPDHGLLGLRLVEHDSTGGQIHLGGGDVHAPLAGEDLVADVEEGDGEEGEVGAEEGLGVGGSAGSRVEGSVERGDQGEDVEAETEVAANDTEGGLVGNEIHVEALSPHTRAHADVSQADATPDEEEAETSKSQEPAEDLTTAGGSADVGKETEGNLEEDTVQGATLRVDVLEEGGGHVALSHSLNGSGRAESARVGDTEDGDGDDSVHDAGEDLDTGILDSKNEGRGLGVGTAGSHETRVVGGEDETDDEQVQDVEDGNSPEDLLASHGDRLAGVGRLGSGQTNHLSTTEGEGSNDEDTAETLEVGESTGVVPVLGANVSLVAGTTTVDDNTEDDETNTGADLDDTEDEFDFSVAADSEDLDDDEGGQEDGNPHCHVDILSPELDGDGGSDQLEGKNS